MKSQWGFCVSFLVLPVCLLAQDRPAQPRTGAAAPANQEAAVSLPVKRVVLYKSGIGYFEHLGAVRDNQDVTVPFTSGQLNDVLKSLTVLDLNGGRIAGVEYGSTAPVDRQLGDLRLPVGDKASLTEFLAALRGTRLEVHSGTTAITGRLLSIERKTRVAGGTTLEVDYLSLLTDNGELKTTELSPAFSVRLLERGLLGKMDRFLDVVSAGREADVRRMVITATGSGERSLFVSYISEVPVWKTTYRIVLSPKAGPLLQGWAIVDNTVGEDWDQVQLSLVAGAPHSFIQNLSQPYYSRRPVVPLPESVAVAPQTYEATLIQGAARLTGIVTDPTGAVIADVTVKAYEPSGSLVGETTTDSSGRYVFDSLPDGAIRLEVQHAGFQRTVINGLATNGRSIQQDARLQIGSTTETAMVTGAPSVIDTETSRAGSRSLGTGRSLGGNSGPAMGRAFGGVGPSRPSVSPSLAVDVARARTESAASAQELGDLFEYKIKEPITIRKNRSALVPIVQAAISAEKVSIWNEQSGLPRPQRALWLTNSSGLTLDGGSFSVMEDETFAGEGIFEPIHPGEKRLVSYATDLALNASSRNSTEQQRVSRVIVNKGVMSHESEVREKKTYTFRNEDTTPRLVIVEHPLRVGYELRSAVQPIESTAAWKRFPVQVGSKQTAVLVVEDGRTEQTSYALSDITGDQVALFVREKSINTAIEEALRRVVAQKAVIADFETQKAARESEIEQIFDDQQRLRENMKSLRGSAEEKSLLQRYTQQLNEQENRLATLRKENQQIEAQQSKAQAELDRMIQELVFDVKL